MRMKNELRAVAGAAVVALLVAGCGSNLVPRPVMAHGVAVREPLVDPRPYGTADAAFGLDVLGAVCRSDPRANLVLSPSSLASGLGMAYLGARGGTARAMAGVLRLPAAGGQALQAGLQARSAALRGLGGPGVTLDASDQIRSVSFPKVNIATQVSMKPVLTGLGMGVAFTPAADFTGLSPQACCIGLVEHAATLAVGEKGTVASAATAVGVQASAGRMMPFQVSFDRPYLMVVTDRATGEPLFMARVADPTAR
jgi:serine protease inhibitor